MSAFPYTSRHQSRTAIPLFTPPPLLLVPSPQLFIPAIAQDDIMSPRHVPRHREDRKSLADQEYWAGRKYARDAEKWFQIPRSTVQYAAVTLIQTILKQAGRPRPLTYQEKKPILALLTDYANKGIPMDSRHVQQAAAIMVTRMKPARQSSLPFCEGNPGRKWVRNFTNSHNKLIKFSKLTKQETGRFAVCSGEF